MNMNPFKDALIEELAKLPLPGDTIIDFVESLIKYQSGKEFPAPYDHRLMRGDTVKEISYELFDDGLYITIGHSYGCLQNEANKSINMKDLIKVSRLKKLERLSSIST